MAGKNRDVFITIGISVVVAFLLLALSYKVLGDYVVARSAPPATWVK